MPGGGFSTSILWICTLGTGRSNGPQGHWQNRVRYTPGPILVYLACIMHRPRSRGWWSYLVLTGLNWKIFFIYLDDVIVNCGNFYDALDKLKQVWQHIREAQLKLKPFKCCFTCDRVPFLGHYMSREGIEINSMNTDALQVWPTSRTVKDVRAFLGLASYYYRRYIPNFASRYNQKMPNSFFLGGGRGGGQWLSRLSSRSKNL